MKPLKKRGLRSRFKQLSENVRTRSLRSGHLLQGKSQLKTKTSRLQSPRDRIHFNEPIPLTKIQDTQLENSISYPSSMMMLGTELKQANNKNHNNSYVVSLLSSHPRSCQKTPRNSNDRTGCLLSISKTAELIANKKKRREEKEEGKRKWHSIYVWTDTGDTSRI